MSRDSQEGCIDTLPIMLQGIQKGLFTKPCWFVNGQWQPAHRYEPVKSPHIPWSLIVEVRNLVASVARSRAHVTLRHHLLHTLRHCGLIRSFKIAAFVFFSFCLSGLVFAQNMPKDRSAMLLGPASYHPYSATPTGGSLGVISDYQVCN